MDSRLQIAAVAGNGSGLHVVDLFDPMQPRLLRTITVNARQVDVVDGIVYAAVETAVNAYDMLTGELLQTLPLGGGKSHGPGARWTVSYTMDSIRVLRAIDISGPFMDARGALSMPQEGGKLFVGDGIAYVAAGDDNMAVLKRPMSPTPMPSPYSPPLITMA